VAEYTVLTVVAMAAVVDPSWFRTGIFATAQYWIAL
jgi:hypothetical protein